MLGAAFVALASWIAVFSLWAMHVTASPLDEPIALSPAGSVKKGIRIPVPEKYQLELVFSRAGISYADLKSLTGEDYEDLSGKVVTSGTRIPIHWTVTTRVTEREVASGNVDSFGSSGTSGDAMYRRVGEVAVPAGDYVFAAEVLRDVPEFARIGTHISMRLRPKFWTTWQLTFARWGSVATVLLALPAALIVGLVLVIPLLRKAVTH